MKVISIANDRSIFEEGSATRARMVEYGTLVEELHIVTFSKRSHHLQEQKLSPNVFAYPTNSFSKLTYMRRAKKIGARLLKEIKGEVIITVQDPFETGLVGKYLSKRF